LKAFPPALPSHRLQKRKNRPMHAKPHICLFGLLTKEKRKKLVVFGKRTGVEAATGPDEATRKSMEKLEEII